MCPICNIEHDQYTWASLGLVCGRCNQHTGNSSQGHYWSMCTSRLREGADFKASLREPHFCCPDSCELDEATDA